jgi:hypothetical protein
MKDDFDFENSSKLDIVKHLINQGYTQKEIALRLNVSVRKITCFTNYYGLKNHNKSVKMTLNNIQEQVILGSLLGDGTIDKYGRLRIQHSSKKLFYNEFKNSLLQSLVKSFKKDITRFDKRTKKTYYSNLISTKCVKPLKEYYLKWYNNSIKTININDFELLNELGLAIWFMDDGFKCNRGIKLATESFERKSLLQIIKIIYVKFDVLFKIDKTNRLYLTQDEYYKFHNLIFPHILPEFYYKLQSDQIIKNGVNSGNGEIPNPDPLSIGI